MKSVTWVCLAAMASVSCSDGTDYSGTPSVDSTGSFADINFEYSTPYEWSSRAVTPLGVGSWSPALAFSVHESEQQALANAVAQNDALDWDFSLYSDEVLVPTVAPSSPIGSIVGSKPSFQWAAVADAISYEIRVANRDTGAAVHEEAFDADEICANGDCSVPTEPVELGAASAFVESVAGTDTASSPTIDNSGVAQPNTTSNPGDSGSGFGNGSNSEAINVEIEALQQSEGVLAFPGALGYARNSVGGRNGRIITVNTVDDVVNSSDNLMSLREALEVESGPRTVVFSVGGVFDTGSEIILMRGENDSFVTLACQTAPSPGVIIRTYGIDIREGAHDIVMRHCALRNIDRGSPFGVAGRSFTIRGATNNIILDHMSLAWATDENLQAYLAPGQTVGIGNFTLSNSAVVEGDADSSHPQSAEHYDWHYHAMGPSCNDNNNTTSATISSCSIVNNFIAHNSSRNAMIWGGAGELSNNVIYNWYGIGLTVQPHDGGDVDAIVKNNIMKAGQDTVGAVRADCADRLYKCAMYLGATNSLGVSRYDASDNYFIPEGENVNDAILINHPHADTPAGKPPFDPATPSTTPITDMAAQGSRFMSCVGASRPQRDHVDARVVQEFYDGTGRIGIGESNRSGGHNVNVQRTWSQFGGTAYHPNGYDSDGDGMPDEWESAHGTDPNNYSDHAGDLDGDGYTNVEEYLAIAAHC